MLRLLRILSLMLCLGITTTQAKDLAVVYEPSKTYDAIRQSLQSSESFQELISALNESLKLPKGLKIVFNGKEDEDAAYDPDAKQIIVSYAFVNEIKDLYTDNKADIEGTPTEAAIDVMIYILIHEIAHALIHNYDLPIVGKEEDAADSLSSVILSEYFENGQEVILTAADFFDLISADRKEFTEEDFWDEHSLDEQRFYNALCHVYGSDPKKYAEIKKLAGFSTERAELCIEEYAKLVDSWSVLLKPYSK